MHRAQRPKRSCSRRSLLAAILVALTTAGCASGRFADDPGLLRIMTFNIHHGEGTDGKIDLRRLAEVILTFKPDVVALQEVDRWVERSGRVDIITTLSDLTGYTYAFGKTISYQGGEYGNGVLTRFPILEERNILLKGHDGTEQRGVLKLLLDARGQEIVFMNTHLDHSADERHRLNAVRELLAEASACSARTVILCGDFNATPGEQPIAELRTAFHDAWDVAGDGAGYTYPSPAPDRRLDYVFICSPAQRGERTPVLPVPIRSAVTHCTSASDHCALVIELLIEPPQ